MKNNRLILVVLTSLMLVTMACGISIPRNDGGSVRGSGNVISVDFTVEDFNSVTLNGSGNLHITQGDKEELRVEAEDNIIDAMDIHVQGHTLEIGWKTFTNVRPSRSVDYYLTVKDLQDVRLFGSGTVQIDDLTTDKIKIVLTGSGNIAIENLSADTLDLDVPGSGEIQATGEAKNLYITIRGSADYYGRDLLTKNARVKIFGSANTLINVSDDLNVTIAGSGTVRYVGSPDVHKSITGSGDIRQESR